MLHRSKTARAYKGTSVRWSRWQWCFDSHCTNIYTDRRSSLRSTRVLFKKKLPLIAANHVSFCIPPQCFLLVSHAVEATMRLLIHLRMRLFTARCHQTGVIPPPVEISHHKSQYTPTDHIKHIMSIILQSAHGNQCRSEQWCQTAQHDH